MHVRCLTGRHAAAQGEVRNQGFDFSRCRRCGRDMIRSHRDWQIVPRGFRVVWKQRAPAPAAVDPAQLAMDLPATGRALIVATPKAERELSQNLLLMLSGLRVLVWTARDRFDGWRRRLFAARPAGASVICLAPYGQAS